MFRSVRCRGPAPPGGQHQPQRAPACVRAMHGVALSLRWWRIRKRQGARRRALPMARRSDAFVPNRDGSYW